MPETILSRMLENTNAPGFDKILKRDSKKNIWIAVVLLGFIALVVSFSMLLERYLKYPVMLETEYLQEKFIFPDVTLCHTGPYSIWRSSRSKEKIDGDITGYDIVHRVKNFWKHLKYPHLPLNKYTREDNEIATVTLQAFAHGYDLCRFPHETIASCRYRSSGCSYVNFTITKLPFYLNCYTFSPPKWEDREVKKVGESEGLTLLLSDIDRRLIGTPVDTMDYSRGFVVATNAAGSRPDMSRFHVASVGRHTKIHMSSVVKKFMDRPARHCHHDHHKMEICSADQEGRIVVREAFDLDQMACQYSSIQKKFVHECGCISEHYDAGCLLVETGYTYCHMIPSQAIHVVYRSVNQTVFLNTTAGPEREFSEIFPPSVIEKIEAKVACHNRVFEGLRFVAEMHECHADCIITQYRSTVSTVVWPESVGLAREALTTIMDTHFSELSQHNLSIPYSDDYKGRSVSSTTRIQQSFARLTLFPVDSHALRIIEVPAYPFTALISDIGGMLGLWVGFSVLHIIELLDGMLSGLCDSGEKEKKRKTNIATISIGQRRLSYIPN